LLFQLRATRESIGDQPRRAKNGAKKHVFLKRRICEYWKGTG
jgi:hypothetical protein